LRPVHSLYPASPISCSIFRPVNASGSDTPWTSRAGPSNRTICHKPSAFGEDREFTDDVFVLGADERAQDMGPEPVDRSRLVLSAGRSASRGAWRKIRCCWEFVAAEPQGRPRVLNDSWCCPPIELPVVLATYVLNSLELARPSELPARSASMPVRWRARSESGLRSSGAAPWWSSTTGSNR
jgi:hypothetical protein